MCLTSNSRICVTTFFIPMNHRIAAFSFVCRINKKKIHKNYVHSLLFVQHFFFSLAIYACFNTFAFLFFRIWFLSLRFFNFVLLIPQTVGVYRSKFKSSPTSYAVQMGKFMRVNRVGRMQKFTQTCIAITFCFRFSFSFCNIFDVSKY